MRASKPVRCLDLVGAAGCRCRRAARGRSRRPRPTAASIVPSAGVAPSATTTIEKLAPARWRCVMRSADLFDVERVFGEQDDVGAAGEAGVRRDPARVTPHHLDDHHAVVTLRRGVQPVDRVGCDLHCGVEPEREVGGRQVVVDRLRHADHLHAVRARACARRRACLRLRSRSARSTRSFASVDFTRVAPSSVLYGLVRDVPRIVPPRGSSPRTELDAEGIDSPSITPRQPWR